MVFWKTLFLLSSLMSTHYDADNFYDTAKQYIKRLNSIDAALTIVCKQLNIDIATVKQVAECRDFQPDFGDEIDNQFIEQYKELFTTVTDLPGFRETFKPFSYKEIDVTIGGVLLFTGTLVSVVPEITPERKSIVAGGYSLPGVLNDCTMPASAAPLEYHDQNLQQIAESVADVFGLRVEFTADPGAVFEPPVRMDPGKKVLAFLTELAKQRKLVIGNTESGALLFRGSTGDGAPAANFRQGERPLTSINPLFNPQEYFSDITGIQPVYFGLGGDAIPEKNPWLPGVMRPHTFNITDTESAAGVDVVKAKIGRMFGNAVSYSVEVATIRDPAGAVWAPDSVVTLFAPDAMVYNESRFTIRSVDISRTRTEESAVLNLVLPGAFGGLIPEALPWDD